MKGSLYFNMQTLRLAFLFELFCFLDCIQIAPLLILWVFPPFIIPSFLQSELNVNCMLPQYCCAWGVGGGWAVALLNQRTALYPGHCFPATASCVPPLPRRPPPPHTGRDHCWTRGFIWDPLGEE